MLVYEGIITQYADEKIDTSFAYPIIGRFLRIGRLVVRRLIKRVFPHVIVSIFIMVRMIGVRTGLEPSVIVAGMIRYKVQNDFEFCNIEKFYPECGN